MAFLRLILNFVKYLGFGGFVACGLFILGHADDARIPLPDISKIEPRSASFRRLFETFQKDGGPTLDFKTSSEESYQASVETIKKIYPLYLKTKSERFSSPYQIHIAVGAYPEKTVIRNALVLKDADEVTITPSTPTEGKTELRFGWIAVAGPASLEVKNSSSPTPLKLSLAPMPAPHDPYGFFYRNLWRYIFPDPQVYTWSDHKIPITHSETGFTFTCHSQNSGFCIISEPSLWEKTDAPQKPNIIMILVDTLRFDAISAKNTPFLWKLKKDAINYEHTISSGNHTASSVSSLLTCQQPSHIKPIAFSYFVPEEAKEAHYKKHQDSMGLIFRQNGWETGLIGSISLFSEVTGVGVDYGFADQVSIERPTYNTAQMTRDSINWLDQHKDSPFFLYVHYDSPHGPYRPPISYAWQNLDSWRELLSSQGVRYWLYRSTVNYTDAYLEKLFDAIKRMNLYEDTYIVITADHADQHKMLSFKGNELGPAQTGSFIGHPYTAYDDEIRIPLIFKPTRTASSAPKSTDVITSLLDVPPTLYEAVGIPIPKFCNGTSLHKFNTIGDFGFDPQKRLIPVETDTKNALIFHNQMKYIRTQKPVHTRLFVAKDANFFSPPIYPFFISEELFDLKADPSETANLIQPLDPASLEARALYNQFYGIKENFHLALEVRKPSTAQVYLGNKLLLNAKIEEKKQLDLGPDPAALLSLRVLLNGAPLPLRLTTAGIPLRSLSIEDISGLPVESPRELPSLGKDMATIFKSYSNESEDRALYTGNAQFEKLLREWGYLKD